LVPALDQFGMTWRERVEERGPFTVRIFCTRTGQDLLRFEQWLETARGRVHWRVRDADDVVTVYGLDASGVGRIADPGDPDHRTFAWLPEAQYEPNGNSVRFVYLPETADGLDPAETFEHGLRAPVQFAQRYLKRVLYGNSKPIGPDSVDPTNLEWFYEVVLDYNGDGRPDLVLSQADRFTWYPSLGQLGSEAQCLPGQPQRLLVAELAQRRAQLGQHVRIVGEGGNPDERPLHADLELVLINRRIVEVVGVQPITAELFGQHPQVTPGGQDPQAHRQAIQGDQQAQNLPGVRPPHRQPCLRLSGNH
jgi:hypothetical protein